MSLDTLKADLAKYADPVIRALELVQTLTGVGGPPAAEALVAIAAVLHTLEAGAASDLSAQNILAELDKLAPSEAADDADAEAAIAAKFPPTSTAGV
jgi:MoxR-like ATPase